MRHLFVSLILLSVVLCACAAQPEVSPTYTPWPTWTSRPHGILRACIYFDNELVDLGYLTFKNEMGRLDNLYTELIGGCKDVLLPPGSYEIVPHYYQGTCSDSTVICRPKDNYQIEISVGEVIEFDFEVFFPE
jgi:hypothetical protein